MYTHGAHTAADEPSSPPSIERPKRRLAIVLAIALVTVLAMGTSTFLSATRANGWKQQSDERAARITALEAELQSAEAEVTAIETRVDELAAEAATAQDQRSAAELITTKATELTELATVVAHDLATCVEGTTQVVGLFSKYASLDPDATLDYVEEVDRVCTKALAGNALLQSSLK